MPFYFNFAMITRPHRPHTFPHHRPVSLGDSLTRPSSSSFPLPPPASRLLISSPPPASHSLVSSSALLSPSPVGHPSLVHPLASCPIRRPDLLRCEGGGQTGQESGQQRGEGTTKKLTAAFSLPLPPHLISCFSAFTGVS